MMENFNIDPELAAYLNGLDETHFEALVALNDGLNDEETELYVYLCILWFQKYYQTRQLYLASHRASAWARETSRHHPDYDRRCNINAFVTNVRRQRELSFTRFLIQKMSDEEFGHVPAMQIPGFNNFKQEQIIDPLLNFQRSNVLQNLNKAIGNLELVLAAEDEHLPEEALIPYAHLLITKFEITRTTTALNQVIEAMKAVVAITPIDHPEYARRHMYLIDHIGKRIDRTRTLDDVDWLMNALIQEVHASRVPASSRRIYFMLMMKAREDIFELTGSTREIDEAVSVAWRAVESEHPSLSEDIAMSHVLNGFRIKDHASGLPEDIDHCIDITTKYLDSTTDGGSTRSFLLGNLTNFLRARAMRTGAFVDIHRAMDTSLKFLSSSQDESNRGAIFHSAASMAQHRYRKTHSLQDLNQALSLMADGNTRVPPTAQNYRQVLYDRAKILLHRYNRYGSKDDLDDAISLSAEALELIHQDDPQYAAYLSLLSHNILLRGTERRSLEDVTAALHLARKAVDATEHIHGSENTIVAEYMFNLAHALTIHSIMTKNKLESEEAKMYLTKAAGKSPTFDNNRLVYLLAHGMLGEARVIENQDQGLSGFREVLKSGSANPQVYILAAMGASNILMRQGDWTESAQLLEDATALLPTISQRSLDYSSTQYMLPKFFGLASKAAAVALSAGKDVGDALRLLDLGRGIIAGLLLDIRGDISNLQLHHPDLAKRFIDTRNELDQPTPIYPMTPGASIKAARAREAVLSRRRQAEEEFDQVTKEIRTRPNFSNFLQAPTMQYLRIAAKEGPIVVINIADFRCDAFLAQHDSIRAIPLPDVTKSDIEERSKQLRAHFDLAPVLSWLWNTICRPCLDALNFTSPVADDGDWPHVWWIPTGALSQFPLHAAGIHTSSSKDTVLDRVQSSYAPSLRAMLHSREYRARQDSLAPRSSALVVCMKTTPGLEDRPLHFASEEAELVKDTCAALDLTPVTPPSEKQSVISHLQNSKIFHFAGHGESDTVDPSQSKLLLDDWQSDPLLLQDLRDSRLQDNQPFLAYLSACSTGSNNAKELADEGIHLISAFQLAGFRHVIGTLWEVSDRACVDVAKVLYRTLQEKGMNDAAVCHGLHLAVRALRDEARGRSGQQRNAKLLKNRLQREERLSNFSWVPYVHFGA